MIKIFEENNWLSWMTTILIAIAIFVISSIPAFGSSPVDGEIYSYIYHFFAFFFLAFFFSIALTNRCGVKFLPIVVFVSIIYGFLDEFHQYFVPGRFFSFGDVLTDSLGVIFGVGAYYLYLKILR